MDTDIASELAAGAGQFMQRPLKPSLSKHVERACIDWFAAYFSGIDLPVASIVANADRVEPGSALGSALVSGTAAHAAETDDIFAPGTYHPGAPVFAALLDVADHSLMTGRRFAQAAVVGYEIGCSVAADLGPAHYHGWHTTGTVGGIAAAGAVAAALGGDTAEINAAISIATTMSSGMQATFRQRADIKPLHSGNAAASGVLAAKLALQGMHTSSGMLDGPNGMAALMSGSGTWDYCHSAFSHPFAIAQVTTKPYPCCGHCFAPIDAAVEIRRQVGELAFSDVADVVIETYGAAVEVAGRLDPTDPAAARFSFPHAVSAVLMGLEPTAAMFTTQAIAATSRIRTRVRVASATEFERRFPHRRGARVTVRLASGETVTSTVNDRSGSPERPLNDSVLEEKLQSAADQRLAAEDATELLVALRRIADLPTVAQLRQAVVGRTR